MNADQTAQEMMRVWKENQMAETSIRKGVSWASLTALIIGIAIIAYLAYQSTSKTDTTNYAKGTTHTESTLTIAPVEHNYPLSLPRCGRMFSVDPNWIQPKDTKDVAPIKRTGK